RSVVRLGEGQHNVAYLVNDELIVRFSKAAEPEQRAARVRSEAGLLVFVAAVSTLPVPAPLFTVAEQGCLAYSKIPGVPLRDQPLRHRLTRAASIGARLGEFLGALHAVPLDHVAELVETDADPPPDWLRDAMDSY